MNNLTTSVTPHEKETVFQKQSWLSFFSESSLKLLGVTFFGLTLYYFFKPEELTSSAWLLFSVFVSNILAIILKPLPMGALALIAISILTLTKTLTLSCVLSGFSSDLIWLIVMACFLARSFIKTGLGRRIAFLFVSFFGGSPLGLSYGLLLSSAAMSPLIPSATARTGGIIVPVLESLIRVLGGKGTKVAQLLTLTVFHGSVISSAIFVTANAGNPITLKFAKNLGIDISWATWTQASFLPALLSLALMPLLLRFFIPCHVEDSEKVRDHAKDELALMGKVSTKEKITLGIFGLLLALWSCGHFFGVHPTEAALFGVGLLIVFHVLTWKDILSEDMAWDTFFWMAILVMMASELQTYGVVGYFTDKIVTIIPGGAWYMALITLSVIYFYSHYFFASTTAHLSSMYGPFLAVCISQGAPPLLSALMLGFISNLFGGLTHYSSGPAPILYAQGHVDVKTWWKIGAISSLFYLAIWLGVGSFWCKFIGLY